MEVSGNETASFLVTEPVGHCGPVIFWIEEKIYFKKILFFFKQYSIRGLKEKLKTK